MGLDDGVGRLRPEREDLRAQILYVGGDVELTKGVEHATALVGKGNVVVVVGH